MHEFHASVLGFVEQPERLFPWSSMYLHESVGHGDEQWLQLETQIKSGKVSDNCAGFELVWLEMGLVDVGHTEAYEVRGHISFIHAVICDGGR